MQFHMIDNGLLKHPHQNNPCYRKVICHGYFKDLKKNNNDVISTTKRFQEMIAFLKTQKDAQPFLLDSNHLKIYLAPMTNKGERGCIIDSNRACYPLIIYPDSHTTFDDRKNPPRLSAFYKAIEKLEKNWQKILDTMKDFDEWNEKLESALEPMFDYPPRRKASNDPDYPAQSKTG